MSCSESPFLCQWVRGYLPYSLLLDSGYLVLCWGPRFIWSWVLYRVRNKDLISFYILSSLTSTTCWRCYLFSSVYQWALFQKSNGCQSVGLCVAPQFYCTEKCVSFIVITMLFNYYSSLTQLGIWDSDTVSCPFIVFDCVCESGLCILGHLCFHMKFKIVFNFCEEFWWQFHWIYILLLVRLSFSQY